VNTEDTKIEICFKEAKEYLSDVECSFLRFSPRSGGGRHTQHNKNNDNELTPWIK